MLNVGVVGLRPPNAFETSAGDARVMHSMLWIALTEVVLNQPQVIALIGQVKATRMAGACGDALQKA